MGSQGILSPWPWLTLLDLAAARGVPGVRFYPLQRLGRAAERWSELRVSAAYYARVYDYLYREVPRSDRKVVVQATLLGFALNVSESEPWCGLGRTLAVDADGDIYPCSMLMAPEFRLGNVEESSLDEAMRSPRLRRPQDDHQGVSVVHLAQLLPGRLRRQRPGGERDPLGHR